MINKQIHSDTCGQVSISNCYEFYFGKKLGYDNIRHLTDKVTKKKNKGMFAKQVSQVLDNLGIIHEHIKTFKIREINSGLKAGNAFIILYPVGDWAHWVFVDGRAVDHYNVYNWAASGNPSMHKDEFKKLANKTRKSYDYTSFIIKI